MRHLLDTDTVKVLLAATTPFIVWGAELELALRILAGLGAVVYIAVKITLLINKGGERE